MAKLRKYYTSRGNEQPTPVITLGPIRAPAVQEPATTGDRAADRPAFPGDESFVIADEEPALPVAIRPTPAIKPAPSRPVVARPAVAKPAKNAPARRPIVEVKSKRRTWPKFSSALTRILGRRTTEAAP